MCLKELTKIWLCDVDRFLVFTELILAYICVDACLLFKLRLDKKNNNN